MKEEGLARREQDQRSSGSPGLCEKVADHEHISKPVSSISPCSLLPSFYLSAEKQTSPLPLSGRLLGFPAQTCLPFWKLLSPRSCFQLIIFLWAEQSKVTMPLAESCLPKAEFLHLELHPGYSPTGELHFRLQTACLAPPEAMQIRFYKLVLVFLWVMIRLNTHSYLNIPTAQRHTIIT